MIRYVLPLTLEGRDAVGLVHAEDRARDDRCSMWLSRSLESKPLPGLRVILEPQADELRELLLLRMSRMPMALFSCSVTQAVFESCDTAMYSGSRSCATVASGSEDANRRIERRAVERAETRRRHVGLRQRCARRCACR